METVINNPSGGSGEGSGMGMMVGVLVALVLVVLFVVYVLPGMRDNQNNDGGDVNIEIPALDANNNIPPSGGSGGSGGTGGGSGY